MTASQVAGLSGVKDSAVVLSMRLLNIVASIGVQSCLAWFLAPEGRGAFGVCLAFAAIMAVVFSFGADRAMQYYVISKRYTVAEGTVIAMILALLGSTAAMLLGWFLIESSLEFFQKADNESFRISLAMIPLLMAITSLHQVLGAKRRFAIAGVSMLLSAAINGVVVVALVGMADLGVPGALVAMMLSQVVTVVYCLAALWRYEGIRLVSVPMRAFRDVFSYGARYYVARLGVSINAHLPLFLLASFAASEEIGWFITASVLMGRVSIIPISINQAIQPRVGSSPDGRPELVAQSARMLMVIVGLCLVVVVVPSRLIVPILFSPAFAPSVPILWILAAGVFIRSATRPMVAYFIGVNRPGMTSFCTAVQLAAVVVAVPWFYQVGGIHGAGWAIVVGQLLEGICLAVAFRIVSDQTFRQTWMPRAGDVRLIKASFWAAMGKVSVPKVFQTLDQADRHRGSVDARQIILLDQEVIKRQNPTLARIELEKTRQGVDIGEACGLFRVPRILDAAMDAGEIHLERLHDFVPLWYALRRGGDANELLVRVGRSLAAIHNRLQLPAGMTLPTSSNWGEAAVWPMVFLHGDFNTLNLLVDSDSGQLLIIDWSVTDGCAPAVGTLGPCYFDVAWFIQTMHLQRYLGLDRIRGIDEKVNVFLGAYFGDIRHPCSIDGLRDYLSCVFFPASRSLPTLNRPLWERILKVRYLQTSVVVFAKFVRRFASPR